MSCRIAKHPDQTGTPKPVQTTAAQSFSMDQAQTSKSSSLAKNRDCGQATNAALKLRYRPSSRAQSASKLAQQEQKGVRTVARDTDKLATPSPAVELTRKLPHQPTRAHEQARSLDHSVTRSLGLSIARSTGSSTSQRQHPPVASLISGFSDLWYLRLGGPDGFSASPY